MADSSKTLQIVVSLKDGVSKGLGNVQSRISKLTGAVFNLKTALVGVGLGLVAKSFIEAASTAEGYQVRLDVLLGSQEDSAKAFKDTAEYASTVSHQFEELMQSTTTLAGVMTEGSEQIKEWLPLIGDLAAVSGLTIQETTSNFIRMYSAGAAAADLFRERGILALLGITAKTQYTVEQTRKILMDAWKDPASKFRDAAEDLARTWKGLLSMMADRWFLFRMDVMKDDSDIFGNMKAALALLVDKIDEMKESGDLQKWAEEMSNRVTDAFWNMALGVASVYDTMAPILSALWKAITWIWDWFKELPTAVQTVGIVGFVLTGSAGTKILVVALMEVTKRVKELKDNMEGNAFAIRTTTNEIEKLKKSLPDQSDFSFWGLFDSGAEQTVDRIKELETELATLLVAEKEIEGQEIGSIINPDETKKDVSSVLGFVAGMREEVEKKRLEMIEAGKKDPRPALTPDLSASPINLQKAELAELKANLSLHEDWLGVLYEMGLKSFDEYWAARKEDLEKARDAELALLKQMANIEFDPTKKLAIETKIHVTTQRYAQEKIALLKDESDARAELTQKQIDDEAELVRKKEDFQKILDEIHKRAISTDDMSERHAAELLALDEKHARELDAIEQQSIDILTELEKREAEKQLIRDQELEKEKTLADQKKAIWKKYTDDLSSIAGNIADIFSGLYEMSGRENKKLFKITKAAAIASAIVDGAVAAVKAYKDAGNVYLGAALSATIAAKTGVLIAKIKATEMGGSFADGGMIGGHSPHSKADNIRINATAGEYVQPVSTVQHYGSKIMDGIKNRIFPKEMFSGFAIPSVSVAAGSTSFAAGGMITKTSMEAEQPKIEIINVTNPDAIRGLAMDAVHKNRDVVVNMVLNEFENRDISIVR